VFVYDKVFKPNATQESVYNLVAKPIVKGKFVILCIHFKWSLYFFIFYCGLSGIQICTQFACMKIH